MNLFSPKRLLLSTALLALPMLAHAHKAWLLPSETQVSGNAPLVTVDAAVSNDIFYFNHNALRLDALRVTGPDGTDMPTPTPTTGRYRSVFDVPLPKPGTYRIGVAMNGIMAGWKEGTEQKRWRGSAAEFARNVPAKATDLTLSQSASRIETFVSSGAPTTAAIKPTGQGMEMEYLTHPNDMATGEPARMRLLVDGKPAADVEVQIIRGGTRYRNAQEEMKLKTNANGELNITWREPGMYWLEASATDHKTDLPQVRERRLSYVATLEVLPQ